MAFAFHYVVMSLMFLQYDIALYVSAYKAIIRLNNLTKMFIDVLRQEQNEEVSIG
jgi:hypothetical protein